MKNEVFQAVDGSEAVEEHVKEPEETFLYSLSPLPLLLVAALPGAGLKNAFHFQDAELLAAEEGLSGLVEVKIQYSGDGEIVEVAGSFNGWHERIKMDPQPSSSVTDTGSRKSKLWSTMLWLYTGAYEMKFIVNGHWRIDPYRESVTRGGISNNVLRVVG